jgi:hypothetical protein
LLLYLDCRFWQFKPTALLQLFYWLPASTNNWSTDFKLHATRHPGGFLAEVDFFEKKH